MRLRKFALLGALTFFTYVGFSDARTAPMAVHSLVNMPPDRSYMRLVVCTSDQAEVCHHRGQECIENIACPGGGPRDALGICVFRPSGSGSGSGGVDEQFTICAKSTEACLQVCGGDSSSGSSGTSTTSPSH